jgi:hypothetical protein
MVVLIQIPLGIKKAQLITIKFAHLFSAWYNENFPEIIEKAFAPSGRCQRRVPKGQIPFQ